MELTKGKALKLNREFLKEIFCGAITEQCQRTDSVSVFVGTGQGRPRFGEIELAYRIKAWADERHYSIHSDFSGNAIVNINKYEYFCDKEFNKESEFEAVYKAGLWVFDKLKEQNNDNNNNNNTSLLHFISGIFGNNFK